MSPTATGRRHGDGTMSFRRPLPLTVEETWAAITDPQRTARWFGPWSGDPSAGPIVVTMTAEEGSPDMPATVLEARRSERLRLQAGEGPDAWVLTLTVESAPEGSAVTLIQVIEDPQTASSIGPGWDYYLDRLVAAETGGDVAAIEFDPDYYPGLGDAYRALFDRPASD